ncbi:MAG: hypothetical protein AB2693_29335 [Candidatus Thiodiazotropha sp.]
MSRPALFVVDKSLTKNLPILVNVKREKFKKKSKPPLSSEFWVELLEEEEELSISGPGFRSTSDFKSNKDIIERE